MSVPLTTTCTASTFAGVPPGVAVTFRGESGLVMPAVTVEPAADDVAARTAVLVPSAGVPSERRKRFAAEPGWTTPPRRISGGAGMGQGPRRSVKEREPGADKGTPDPANQNDARP